MWIRGYFHTGYEASTIQNFPRVLSHVLGFKVTNYTKLCSQTGDGNIAIPKVAFGWEERGYLCWVWLYNHIKKPVSNR